MNITKIGTDKKGYFEARMDGNKAGVITYKLRETNTWVIEHTKVEEAYQEQKTGWKLLQALVNYSREKQYKVIPECPFAKKMFEYKTEIQDVLA